MCGINGFTKKNDSLIREMNTRTNHRGPDFSGTYTDEDISLGHLLLSIRDTVDHSKQPIQKEGSPWILLFNGQLYNTSDLKNRTGLSTPLDTSLLYALIEKEGWNFIHHIHGMYAIALYNKKEHEVRLYRDPSGQKLLYYTIKDDAFYFSSELKNIPHSEHLEDASLSLYLTLGYIPGHRTLEKDIYKVEPSQTVSFNLRTKKIIHTFEKITSNPYQSLEKNPALLFTKLVEDHLQGRETVALNLSGGLDSSILLHEARALNYPLHTYTNRFETEMPHYNEDADLASRLARDYKTEHKEIFITKREYFENFQESFETIEEPNFNLSIPAYFLTAKKEGVQGDKIRVVFSGDGGDEVFGGYSYYGTLSHHVEMKKRFGFLFSLIKRTAFDEKDPLKRFLYFKDLGLLKYTKEVSSSFPYIQESALPFLESYGKQKTPIYETMLIDRILWLSGENFIRSDKLYMSQSIELRSPFAYHPFRQTLDSFLTEQDYFKNKTNKVFVRSLYEEKLPSYITKRPRKQGWRAPINIWYDKEFKELFLSILPKENGKHVQWKAIRKEIEEKDTYPGKSIQALIPLAVVAKKRGLIL